ncbi:MULTISPECIES: HAD-IA family hydrolase [Nocardiopsis]|uniref:HAD family hydrolase n=1 Tax=Nocardiopsis sinuspersici TaxID=501010 RepID=A0A1V3C3A8_9ACTN|nr:MULTISPECIES: HAD-IA family hydrolase [Nocardiopsis]NYH51495.1 sugar-phosphatase [Nocardiopsis sinuspersici]OOC55128.1 HAD family hydrolase [Nocardiopsis sinuspersici]
MGDHDGMTVLFDLDGVLVDSAESIRAGLTAWAVERGLDVDTVLAHHHGRTDTDLVRLLAPHLDPASEAPRIEEHEAAAGDGVRAMPGARELLAELDGRGRPWAIVTSGGDRIANSRIQAAGLPLPRVLVTADDVDEGKPHPGPYLLGAERMGAAPGRCVVVEDAASGVRAGLDAGMTVIAVASTTGSGDLAHATTVVGDLEAAAGLLL